jgi:uroporphyrinogen-III decarboxylase
MTAWQRLVRAIRGEPTDYPPLALFGTARYFSYQAGISLSDFYYDPHLMIEAEKRVMNSFEDVAFIPGCWPDYGLGFFTAFGMKIEWPESECSALRDHRYKSFDELISMEPPVPERDGLWPWYLKSLKRFRENEGCFPDRLRCLWSLGPGEICSYLMGLTPFLEEAALDGNKARMALNHTSEIIVSWLSAQRKILDKADMVLITDDIAGLMSPKMYQEILLPAHRMVRESFSDMLFLYHNDTASDHLIDTLPDTGFDAFQLGATTSLATAAKKIGSKMALMGNIDTVNVLQNGTLQEVIAESRRCFKEVGDAPRFILGPSGGMNPGISREKIEAMLECCKERTGS